MVGAATGFLVDCSMEVRGAAVPAVERRRRRKSKGAGGGRRCWQEMLAVVMLKLGCKQQTGQQSDMKGEKEGGRNEGGRREEVGERE